ncbi:MAG: transcriptional repressor [Microbacteriaceae bacterium]
MSEPISPSVLPRNTRQKRAVKAALHEAADFVSAQSLHELLESQGERIGLNTVYRVLSGLVETGDADTINTETETLFRACSTEHHHHLICRECGKTVEIEAEPIENWARTVAASFGYTQPEHLIDIFALCAECSVTA